MKASILPAVLAAAVITGALGLGAALTGSEVLVTSAFADGKAKKPPADATGIEWQVEPDGVEIYLDGKKVGEAGKLTFSPTKPGKHAVRLVRVKDETEIDIEVKKGQTLKFAFKFEDD